MTDLINVSDAARLTGLSRQSLYNRFQAGKLIIRAGEIDEQDVYLLIAERYGATSKRVSLIGDACRINQLDKQIQEMRDKLKNDLEAIND